MVEWRWRQFENATTLPLQASALERLCDAMSDLASFLPGYNSGTGEAGRGPAARCSRRSGRLQTVSHSWSSNHRVTMSPVGRSSSLTVCHQEE